MARVCWLVCGWLLAAWLAGAPAAAERNRPNILLLMAEDLSPRIGAYGDAVARTPHIDQLAAEGTRFTRAFTTAGVCAPSRAAIAMGVHQNHWGAGHMRATAGGYNAVPPPDWKAFPELLRAAGYWTANSGKTDYQMSSRWRGVFGGPFSIWDEDGADGWEGRADGQPFFLYLTLDNTHENVVWPTWRVRSVLQLLMAPLRIRHHFRWEHETDPAAVALPPYYPDTPTVRADLARHYNNVAAMDTLVGRALARLEAEGLSDDTVVIFTTDHGDGLPRAKRWLYDSGIHVPLIVRWLGHVSAGAVDDGLVSGVDLAPTILSLAGAAVPAQMQGRVLVGPGLEPEPSYIYAARDRMDEQPDSVRAVRDTRFKYVRHLEPDLPYVRPLTFRDQMPMMQEMLALHAEGKLGGAPALWFRPQRDAEELFDTRDDPHEVRNLAGSAAHQETLARLRAELDRWLDAAPDLGLLPEDQLAERFWPGGVQPVTEAPRFAEIDGRVSLSCPTEGASIGWRASGEDRFRLYNGSFEAPEGSVEAKAVRYGWEESPLARGSK